MSDIVPLPRMCEGATKSGSPCIQRAVPGSMLCPLHTSPEAASEFQRQLGIKGNAKRWGAAKETEKAEMADVLAAVRLDSLAACEKFLETMARFAVEKNDPRYMSAAAQLVKTSKWVVIARDNEKQVAHWRKRFGLDKRPVEGDPE